MMGKILMRDERMRDDWQRNATRHIRRQARRGSSVNAVSMCGMLTVLCAIATAIGCPRMTGDATDDAEDVTVTVTASAERAERRAYDGAPPVIPHPRLGASCTQCHNETGKRVPERGFAPANPHHETAGLGDTANCRQCHVFRRTDELFAETDFSGLPQKFTGGDRLYPGAPPVIPHRVFMRENCNACHSGPAARPEIRCTHPQRNNCRQCHVQDKADNLWPAKDARADLAAGGAANESGGL